MPVNFDRRITRGYKVPADIRALLKSERIERGWDVREAARKLGLNHDFFRALENGTGRVTHRLETVQLWAGLFGYEAGIVLTKREGT